MQNQNLVKYGSRKFIVTGFQCFMTVTLPFIYKAYGISDQVLLAVLVATSSLVGAYTGFNVLQKRMNGRGG
jgi:hypothetical protein